MPKVIKNRITPVAVEDETDPVETNGFHESESGEDQLVQMEVVVFVVEGVSPLLQNNPADFIGKGGEEVQLAKKVYDDEDEASRRTYKTPDGDYYIPSESFTKAMVRAASGVKIGKEFATNLLKGNVFAAEPYFVIEDERGKPHRKYGIDRRSVVIGKSRVLRCRPCWMKWRVRLSFEVNTNLFGKETLRKFLEKSGRFPGVGDYRPEKGGSFGRFRVVG